MINKKEDIQMKISNKIQLYGVGLVLLTLLARLIEEYNFIISILLFFIIGFMIGWLPSKIIRV